MSFLIVYHSKDFNILVCDTQETHFIAENKERLKMRCIKENGFVSGVGSGELIKKASDKICDFYGVSYNKLLVSLNSLLETLEDPDDSQIRATQIFLSEKEHILMFSLTENEGFHFKVDKLSGEPSNYLAFPLEFPIEKQKLLQEKINGIQAGSSCNHVLLPILEVFQEVAVDSEFVSETACISIMSSNENPFYTEGKVASLLSQLKTSIPLHNLFEQKKSELSEGFVEIK